MAKSLLRQTAVDDSATAADLRKTGFTPQTSKLSRDASADTVVSESDFSCSSTGPCVSDDSTGPCNTESWNLQDSPRSMCSPSATQPNSILKPSFSSNFAVRQQGPCRGLPKPDLQVIHKQGDTTNLKAKPMKDHTVTFEFVIVRRYDQTLGDNPSAPFGPPIQLDWKYEEETPIPIGEFECRIRKWIHPLEMQLSGFQREKVLSYYYGFTKYEMHEAEREVKKIKRQRFRSRLLGPLHSLGAFASDNFGRNKRLARTKTNT